MAKAKLGELVTAASGSIGDSVIVDLRSGTVVRRKPVYKRATSPLQAQVSARMKQSTTVYKTLTYPQIQAWNDFGATQTRTDTLSGKKYTLSGQNAFTALSTKFLQITPVGRIPVAPPAVPFPGDNVLMAVLGDIGKLLWMASHANASGAATELLLQRLPNVRRKPTRHYTALAFVSFPPSALTATTPVEPGWYACAFRFVCPATGEAKELQKMGVVEVR